jgi:hypothetical protein
LNNKAIIIRRKAEGFIFSCYVQGKDKGEVIRQGWKMTNRQQKAWVWLNKKKKKKGPHASLLRHALTKISTPDDRELRTRLCSVTTLRPFTEVTLEDERAIILFDI